MELREGVMAHMSPTAAINITIIKLILILVFIFVLVFFFCSGFLFLFWFLAGFYLTAGGWKRGFSVVPVFLQYA
jgi:hypothetical protein